MCLVNLLGAKLTGKKKKHKSENRDGGKKGDRMEEIPGIDLSRAGHRQEVPFENLAPSRRAT